MAVALTGICLPIGISYALQGLAGASAIQAFAAGAALCSTSLGTTFTVLNSSGSTSTRLGVVLTSAAMMDDVVGLVMVQVISNLGGKSSTLSAVTVIRPVFVSIAFAVIVPLVCRMLVQPLTLWLNTYRSRHPDGRLSKVLRYENTAWVVHTAILVGMVTGSSYAGTSNLFAAYLAGATISWWDTAVPHEPGKGIQENQESIEQGPGVNSRSSERQIQGVSLAQGVNGRSGIEIENSSPAEASKVETQATPKQHTQRIPDLRGVSIYYAYYQQAVERILQPLFFVGVTSNSVFQC
jgi:hypothetical protein